MTLSCPRCVAYGTLFTSRIPRYVHHAIVCHCIFPAHPGVHQDGFLNILVGSILLRFILFVVTLILIGEIGLLGLASGVRHVFCCAFVALVFALLFHCQFDQFCITGCPDHQFPPPHDQGFLAITIQFPAICFIGLGRLIHAA